MDWKKIGIEMGVLVFFAAIYYLLQKRKIGRYHHDEGVEAYALWIYDYHTHMESIQGTPEYQKLMAFVPDVEAVDLSDTHAKKDLAGKIPDEMPTELKQRLLEILNR